MLAGLLAGNATLRLRPLCCVCKPLYGAVMLSIGKLTAAQGFAYLLRAVAHGAEDYYGRDEAVGEAPGRWVGSSDALLGLSGGVTDEVFRAVYAEHADPRTGETLGRTRRVYRSVTERLSEARAQLEGEAARDGREVSPEEWAATERRLRRADRTSVDAYDLTFSPVKSVSVLWAAGDAATRREVWAAHHAAVEEALRVLQREVSFTRSGHHGTPSEKSLRDGGSGGRWEDTGGLVGARFDHRMSRAGDPQIHSHVVVLNMSRTVRDGAWRALDGQALYRAKGLGGAVYEQVLMTELSGRLGVGWRLRADGAAFEVDGVSERLRERFSARRGQVSAQLRPLQEAFRQRYGRQPSAWENTRMAQWATLADRPRKGAPETTTAALARWAAESAAADGRALADVLAAATGRSLSAEPVDEALLGAAAIAAVGQKKTAWTRADLAREVGFRLDAHIDPRMGRAAVTARIEELTGRALRTAGVVSLAAPELLELPPSLRRRDGESVFTAPRAVLYATVAQLSAEERIRAAAAERTDLRLSEEQVKAGMRRAAAATGGRTPSGEQQQVVLAVATSGLRLQALVGPAGTGKTTTMATLAAVWRESTGGRVIGLAPSEIAARQLAAAAGPTLSANTARWLKDAERDPGRWGLRRGDLVLLDEAGMVSDAHLARVVQAARQADARVLLVGDPGQLPSPGAGAAYSMVTRMPGTVTLTEVRRFTADWEAAASLQLRAGNPEALDGYDRRARIHSGTAEQMETLARAAWRADVTAGRASLLLVGSNDDVAAANARARLWLAARGLVDDAPGRTVGLRDGTRAGAGDLVVTRRNDADEAAGGAVNRRRWRVLEVQADGGLRVAPERPAGGHGDRERGEVLSGAYVARQVELGYARTVHGGQGLTVDTAHALVPIGGTDRQALYTAMSRGRAENHVYVETELRDEAGETVRVEQPLAVLARSLHRDAQQRSATEIREAALAAAGSVAVLAPVWADLAGREAAARLGSVLEAALAPAAARTLRADPALPALLVEAWELELAGHDATALLEQAAAGRDLTGAESIARVLRWRLAVTRDRLPEGGAWRGWAALTPADLTPTEGGGGEGRVARQAAGLLDARVAELGALVEGQRPAWAQRLGPIPEDPVGRLVWQERAGVIAGWREYAGVPDDEPTVLGPVPVGPQPVPRMLWRAAHQALGAPDDAPEWSRVPAVMLQRAVQRGRDAVAAAPSFVDGPRWAAHRQLFATRAQLSLVREQLTSLEQPAGGPGGDAERSVGVSTEVFRLEARLAGQQRFLERLEGAADARDRWRAASRELLGQAQRAGRELARRARHGDTPVSTPADATAAERWARLRRAEADRPVSGDARDLWQRLQLRRRYEQRAAPTPAESAEPTDQRRRGLRP